MLVGDVSFSLSCSYVCVQLLQFENRGLDHESGGDFSYYEGYMHQAVSVSSGRRWNSINTQNDMARAEAYSSLIALKALRMLRMLEMCSSALNK